MREFDIIERFFAAPAAAAQLPPHLSSGMRVICGPGDDGALIQTPHKSITVMSMDTLVAGVHFLPDTPAACVGYKALAVNLSDLAAMGAKPSWVMLALTLPATHAKNEDWLQALSHGFFELVNAHGLALLGGDLTRGPLSITCQVGGFIEQEEGEEGGSASSPQRLLRSGAVSGDAIYVIGLLGAAGLALNRRMQQGVQPQCVLTDDDINCLNGYLDKPTPLIETGIALRGIANALIDISDGLLADLGHMASASGVGAHVFQELLPIHPIVQRAVPFDAAVELAVSAGDDYALCCTVPQEKRALFLSTLDALKQPYRYIGTITADKGVRIYDGCAKPVVLARSGYEHYVS